MNNFMYDVIFFLAPIISIVIFILAILMIFNPKVRSKIVSKNIKAMKYVIAENEENLRSIANKSADINKESITTTARAIKDGFSDNIKYCKHCGELIDGDSKFCKKCGKNVM